MSWVGLLEHFLAYSQLNFSDTVKIFVLQEQLLLQHILTKLDGQSGGLLGKSPTGGRKIVSGCHGAHVGDPILRQTADFSPFIVRYYHKACK